MKKLLFIVSLCCSPVIMHAQNNITIEDCYQLARKNYPLIRRYELIEKTKEFNLSNAGKGYLPQVSLSAKATYQSEVTKVPVNIPNLDIEGLSKDQYSATLDLTQTIWDGGVISSQKEITRSNANVEEKQLDTDLYAINDRVNQLYFGILLLDAKLNQNDLLQDELQRNFKLISSYIENGVANQVDLDAIKVEQLKTIQNKAQLQSNRQSYIEMLATLIGKPLSKYAVLQKPLKDAIIISSEINRPELDLFQSKIDNLEVQKKNIKTSYMPKLGLFLTGGYGKPGLNMLENDFSAYYIGGVRLSWNFGSLYTHKNDRKILEAGQSNILTQRETFLFNTDIEVTQKNFEIDRNRELLKYDDEIIQLRTNVKKAAEVKVANGTMTVTDLMREINAEDLAKQDKIQHEIEYLLSIYNLKFTTNN